MVKFVHKEESEITMDYVNLPALPGGDALKSCSGKDGGVTAAVPGETENLQFNEQLLQDGYAMCNFKIYICQNFICRIAN